MEKMEFFKRATNVKFSTSWYFELVFSMMHFISRSYTIYFIYLIHFVTNLQKALPWISTENNYIGGMCVVVCMLITL